MRRTKMARLWLVGNYLGRGASFIQNLTSSSVGPGHNNGFDKDQRWRESAFFERIVGPAEGVNEHAPNGVVFRVLRHKNIFLWITQPTQMSKFGQKGSGNSLSLNKPYVS